MYILVREREEITISSTCQYFDSFSVFFFSLFIITVIIGIKLSSYSFSVFFSLSIITVILSFLHMVLQSPYKIMNWTEAVKGRKCTTNML